MTFRIFLDPNTTVTRGELDRAIMRSIIELFACWDDCDKRCRRAKACADPNVACFDHNREALAEYLRELADWPRLEGPREPDEERERATALFD